MSANILNIAGYKFIDLKGLAELRTALLEKCVELGLKGTILLSEEGTNQFLAGTESAIRMFQTFLIDFPEFQDLHFKESWSEEQPFGRMLVKLKQEIIPLGMPDIKPAQMTVPNLEPKLLKEWLDAGKEVVVLDTRNKFEVEMGTFENAEHLHIDEFRSYPEALAKLPEEYKDKPIVIFCTGGIRCEKAGPVMLKQGFNQVYQLEGGILNYFEQCGGSHYQGSCFVFDQRAALDADLNPSTT